MQPGILAVWPIGILPVVNDRRTSRAVRVTRSSAGETPACPTDKMCVLLSFVTKFDLRRQDCIAGMSRLAEASVDLVVTSPPYNLGISYGKYSDRQDRRSYLGWCGEWAEQIRRVLKSNGSFFLNIGAAPSNPMLPHEIVMTLREFFVLQNTIHWIKSIAIDDHCSRRPVGDARRSDQSDSGNASHREAATAIRSFGHFKPINSPRFLNDCHEYVFHFTKSGRVELNRLALGVPYQDKSNIARWSHTRGKDLDRESVV